MSTRVTFGQLCCGLPDRLLISNWHIGYMQTIPIKVLRFNYVRVNKVAFLTMSVILLILLAIFSLPMMHINFGPKPPGKNNQVQRFEASSSDKNKMLFLPKQMKNSTCWQRRKGIRQTAWHSTVIWIRSVSRNLQYLTAHYPSALSQPTPTETHRKNPAKALQTPTMIDAMVILIHNHIPLTSACVSLNERQIDFGTETWKMNENEILMQILSEKSEIQTWICLFLTSLKRR